MTDRLFIYGASGHAKVVADAARRQGWLVEDFFDDDPELAGTAFMGGWVHGGRQAWLDWIGDAGAVPGIVAIGQNQPRLAVAAWLEQAGARLASVVHPAAVVAEGVEIGAGSVLMAGTVVNSDSRLGRHCIINTAASVDHDCLLGDGVHVAPGCRLCGNVTVGEGALLGAGATIIPGIRVGARAVVGAGSTVIRDVPVDARVAGSPSRGLGR